MRARSICAGLSSASSDRSRGEPAGSAGGGPSREHLSWWSRGNLHVVGAPRGLVADHGVEDSKEFAHGGYEGDLAEFAELAEGW